MSNEKHLVYFMRKPNRIGLRWSYQGTTEAIDYRNTIYFSFIVSEEAATWIKEQSKTHYCNLKYDMLSQTLINAGYPDTHFVDDEELDEVLDISDKDIDLVKSHVDYSVEKPLVNEDQDE
jgi:hypothetical protein